MVSPTRKAEDRVEDERSDCKAERLPIRRVVAGHGTVGSEAALQHDRQVDHVEEHGITCRCSDKNENLHSAASSIGGRLWPSRRSTSSAASARLVPGPKIAWTPAARSAA